MAVVTTIGRLAIEQILPKGFLDSYPRDKPLSHKDMTEILQRVAEEQPDKYKEVSSKILRLGSKASVETGSSFSLKDLMWPIDKAPIMKKVEEGERKIFFDPKLDQKQKNQKLIELYSKYSALMPDLVLEKSLESGSNLARMVASGARGNKSQLNSLIGADFLLVDQNKMPVPIGIKHSYAEGLTLPEYFASAYGARAGTVDGKFAVRDSGFLSKQLSSATMDLIVTESDCATKNGIPVNATDPDNIGAILGRDAGGYKAGQIITKKMMDDFKKDKNLEEIVVRSPITCQASTGGVCAHCAGVREKNRLPKLGEPIGLPASQAHAEPLTQTLLGSKHVSGVANAKKITGFKAINAMFQVPEVFPNKASVSEEEGIVEKIQELPQGGKHVYVNGVPHYISPESTVVVKIGDTVEPGDVLSDGVSNPSDIVRLKGIGQGRLSFLQGVKDVFAENGLNVNRRNIEAVARAAIDHVNVVDPDESSEYLPEDIVRYENFLKSYVPSEGATEVEPEKAIGKYLERPALHYSIGTKITPSVAKKLKKHNESNILVSDHSPSFEPVMVRLMDAPSYNEDWMSQFGTSYIQRNLKRNVVQGKAETDIHGLHPLPGLAYGKEFGKPPPGKVGY